MNTLKSDLIEGRLEPIQQPRPGKQPIPFDGRDGNAENFSGLGFHQAAKKPELHDAARSRIGGGQLRQRLIDRQEVYGLRVLEVRHVRNSTRTWAPGRLCAFRARA